MEIGKIKKAETGNYLVSYNPSTQAINTNVSNFYKMLVPFLLKKVPKMSLDFSSKNTLGFAFIYCFGLEEIDLSQWNIGSINYFKSVFYGCGNLKKVNFDNWDITSTTYSSTDHNINSMFRGCTSLKSIDLSCFKGNWNIGNLMAGCTSLEHLDIRGLNISNCGYVIESSSQNFLGNSESTLGGRVPYNCEIIVADQTQKDYMNTNLPDYTNVKTIAEYEGG